MRAGSLLAVSELVRPHDGEVVEKRRIRFRTMVIKEVALAAQTERGNRADDKFSETAMEDRKREGYF